MEAFAAYVLLAARIPYTPRPRVRGEAVGEAVLSADKREARRKHATYMRRRRASKADVVVD